ncbi:Lsr2 family protein [Mycobacterium sp. 236(2023)]|uniref:histone-like nucleoid-structuring protein Lsr2 n=1 Tax=Mycobacterium sp. 236(2023) TaxID=3038163 RepID=UPI0024158B46|nr:Lsr2 family protein [Mycobacterium sp. 236(2023)]MDG4668643.1 Lsr2 family protein [Mycobacterium sp. 236(2023)]
MAEVIIRQLVDDIDGSEILDGGGERVSFSLRGVDYQIDLSKANVTKLEKAFKPYIAAAEKLGTSRQARRPKAKGNGRVPSEQLAAIRDWARQNGYEVSDRGRIKGEIVEAFETAH